MATKTDILQIRISPTERYLLQRYAEKRGWTMAQVLRECIRRLPTDGAPIPELDLS